MRQSGKQGFTMIELMIVIAIIGLIATIVTASLLTARVKGRDARRVADMNSLKTALELYAQYHDNLYPTTLQGTAQLALANTCGIAACILPLPQPPVTQLQSSYDYCGGTNNASFTLHAVFESGANKPQGPTIPSSGCPAGGQTWVCSGATDYCATP